MDIILVKMIITMINLILKITIPDMKLKMKIIRHK